MVIGNAPAQHLRVGVGPLGIARSPALLAACHHALKHRLVGSVQIDHSVNVPVLPQELGMRLVAREAVQDEAIVPVVLVQPPTDEVHDNLVRDQVAAVQDLTDGRRQLGAVLEVPPNDFTDRDVGEIEVRRQHPALRRLPRCLRADDDVLVHSGSRETHRRAAGASFESTARRTRVANTASGCWKHSGSGEVNQRQSARDRPIRARNARPCKDRI